VTHVQTAIGLRAAIRTWAHLTLSHVLPRATALQRRENQRQAAQGCTSESQYAILELIPNGFAGSTKPARTGCRELRLGASSRHLSDCDCHGFGVAFCLSDPIRSQLGKAVRRADRSSCRHAFHLVDQNIPLSGYAGARESTHYRHRQGRAIPLQSQPYLSRVLAVADWNRTRSQRRGNPAVERERIIQYNYFNNLEVFAEYPGRQPEVSRALMEAWNWLEGEGLLVRDATNPHGVSVFLSRRAQRLKTREDFDAYRKASLLPKDRLHELIATKVFPAFLRGDYDTAVFQAFREVEVAVRIAGRFPSELVGKDLMQAAFRVANPKKDPPVTAGPLTNTALPVAEQVGMAQLFSGAIALFKNPHSHRNISTEAIEAAEVIVFASHLLRIVDRLTSVAPKSVSVKL